MSLKRYSIWNKQDPIIVPAGNIYTAEQWMAKYPVAKMANITIVGSAGTINGGYFGVLSQMKQMYENQGADFSEATTDEEVLEVIEAFEDAQNEPVTTISAEDRIAAALEAQVLLAMPDEI